jgi:hypothetical protein
MPAFMWNPAPGATSYVLSVSDSTQTDKIHMTIAADQAGCATEATCVFNPGVALAAGAAKWAVETIVSSDLNAWSAPVDFIVDTTAPVIQITSPTKSGNFTTTSGSITLAGAAGDNVGVKMVTWSDNHGNSGSAQGLYSWTTSPIALVAGSTTFTVTVADGAGNVASDSLTVNYGASTSRGKKK